ncbi:MAG: Grx4 family monothiol glutaredoxin [Deltaproteobacteria bacterium]|nr:MAG: Grx4 family monothiol glutaredoxin [Deltaproteobacteria bacterium]
MSLDPATRERIESLIQTHPVVLFMKGTRSFPQCGFSATVVQILDQIIPGGYETVNVLADPAIREGIKVYSNWPTIPQLYVNQTFIGGCDIVREMYEAGELHDALGVKPDDVAPPALHVTEAAAEALRRAVTDAGDGTAVHLLVDGQWQHGLDLGPRGARDLAVEVAGVPFAVPPALARRLDGVTIDFVDGPGGGFRIDNPNAPPRVQPLSVAELKAKLDAGEPIQLLDVRTQRERDIAAIAGSRLLDDDVRREVEAMPKDTPLVLYCHHGVRSRQAAEYFLRQGFRTVYNVVGGIDAWAAHIDPSMRRY